MHLHARSRPDATTYESSHLITYARHGIELKLKANPLHDLQTGTHYMISLDDPILNLRQLRHRSTREPGMIRINTLTRSSRKSAKNNTSNSDRISLQEATSVNVLRKHLRTTSCKSSPSTHVWNRNPNNSLLNIPRTRVTTLDYQQPKAETGDCCRILPGAQSRGCEHAPLTPSHLLVRSALISSHHRSHQNHSWFRSVVNRKAKYKTPTSLKYISERQRSTQQKRRNVTSSRFRYVLHSHWHGGLSHWSFCFLNGKTHPACTVQTHTKIEHKTR